MTSYRFDHSILRQYDVRGIVDKTLFPESALLLGGLLAEIIKGEDANPTVVIGGDGRLSTPKLKSALIEGFLHGGVDVIELEGVVATPELYHADYFLQTPLAVQVTGSHNPKEYNGFKMVRGQKPFWGADIAALKDRAAPPAAATRGRHQTRNLRTQYIKDLLADITLPHHATVAWDPGNGALGLALTALLPSLPGQHHVINGTVDGHFPQHHPDPTIEENLNQLKKLVQEKKCDLGIAFDGDGDRIGVVDEDGVVLWGDQLLMFYSRLVLKKNPKATIIADVKASQLFFDLVNGAGGHAVMAPTGHSIIKTEMKKQKALLAGEMSGHIFFADRWPGFDDALYAALRLLEILAVEKTSLKKLRLSLPTMINTPEIRIDVDEKDKWPIVARLKAKLTSDGVGFNDLDGLRVKEEHGWWLVRASNTQNCLVARAEGDSKAHLTQLLSRLDDLLKAVDAPPLPPR